MTNPRDYNTVTGPAEIHERCGSCGDAPAAFRIRQGERVQGWVSKYCTACWAEVLRQVAELLPATNAETPDAAMTREEMESLDMGDVVRNTGSAYAYVVTASYGDRATAVRTTDITNPNEWVLVRKAAWRIFPAVP
jgi:hypothetical protein